MIERLAILMFTITLAACATSGTDTASTVDAGTAQGGATAATSGDGVDADGAAEAEQVAANVEPEEETVCRREKPAGSNISRKVCYKRSALEDRADMDKDALRQMRSRPQLPTSNN